MMNYFFTFLLQPVLPLAILLGCLWTRYQHIQIKSLICLTILGFGLGVIFAIETLSGQILILSFNSVLIVFYLLFYITQFWHKVGVAKLWQFIFSFAGGAILGQNPNIHLITNTDVVNTTFLLNGSASIFGFFFCIATMGWLVILFQQAKADNKGHKLRIILISAVIIMLLLPLTGNVLLSLMKLQIVNITKFRLSYVAKVNNLTNYFNYINALLLFATLSIFTWKVYLPRRKIACQETHPIVKRQKLALMHHARSSVIFGILMITVTIGTQLYWDKVASLPPVLSEATRVQMANDNAIHIPINTVSDGNLHRFVWVASDGRAIRFFIINRSNKKLSLATVFDACLLCGDSGYVVDGDKLMCVACGVRLFIPSVGKAGGCNPIPIDDWQEENNEVIIPKKSLLTGANYFSTVLEIPVVDPVSQQALTNKQANYRYDYNDTTYFFANEHNQTLFRDNPEKYLQNTEVVENGYLQKGDN